VEKLSRYRLTKVASGRVARSVRAAPRRTATLPGRGLADPVPVHEHGHRHVGRAVPDDDVLAARHDERPAWSECGATNVVAIASIPHISTGPPFERLYAVEPEGVEQMIPSHGTLPRSSPPTAHSSSTMRPSTAEVTTRSLTAT
jgi:hypothetical protein